LAAGSDERRGSGASQMTAEEEVSIADLGWTTSGVMP
jgi:hypothetical protein